MNHLIASAPWFLPRSIGIWTHQPPEFGWSFVGTACRCWSHFVMSPDSKLSVKNTSGSFAMPTSPGYFAARPKEMGGTGDPLPTPSRDDPPTEPALRLAKDTFNLSSGVSPVLPQI